MNSKYLNVNRLKVTENLLSFVNNELLKNTGISLQKIFGKALTKLFMN